ncbi:MAG: lipocalin-like domain-containing protein, partial [Anaerolineae bacterium]
DGAQYRHFDGAQYRHFGYQLTFFRQALMPTAPERDSEWGTNQVYMAHFAVTDVAGGRFHNFERFSRGSAGLAGATGTPYHVWLESWLVEETSPGVVRLQASEGDVKLDLTLQPLKPPALHGQAGLSQKSSTPGNASYYYSQTRIETTGSVTVGGQSYAVRGSSWMDHEFGTSFLADNQVGWDWFSLQLDDGRELMFFQIRQDDGGIEPLSGGSLIDADGTVRHLNREDVIIQVLDRWTSPKTGAVYPAGWHLSVPLAGLELDIQPYAGDQELTVSYTYWEGGVQVTGQGANGPISGNGYVELMGYVAQLIVPNS